MTITEHYESARARQMASATIYPDGKFMVHTEFGSIPNDEFVKLYPLGIITKESAKGENYDRTKLWQQDKKSY